MFRRPNLPEKNEQMNKFLQNLFNDSKIPQEQKSVIEKKLNRVNRKISDKLLQTFTISSYFDLLWKAPDLNEDEKEWVVETLEEAQKQQRTKIATGKQRVANTSANINLLIDSFTYKPAEEHLLQEKVKEMRKRKQLDASESCLNAHKDREMLSSVNRVFTNQPNNRVGFVHYTWGLRDPMEGEEEAKNRQAQEFVKKVQGEKLVFSMKMREIEKSVERKEMEEKEVMEQIKQEQEEVKKKERESNFRSHQDNLKLRKEQRIQEGIRWKASYQEYNQKVPLYKEIEEKFQKGFVIPELEEKKKKLQELRDFYKPIDLKELAEHEQRVLKIVEEQTISKKSERSLSESKWNYKKPAYESKFQKEAIEELTSYKRQKEEEQIDKIKVKEKVDKLLQDVKVKYIPRVDPKKQLEVIENISKIRDKEVANEIQARSPRANPMVEDLKTSRQLGNEYLKSLKEAHKKSRTPLKLKLTDHEKRPDGIGTARVMTKQMSGPIPRITPLSNLNGDMSPTPKTTKHNYLTDLRKSHVLLSNRNQVDVLLSKKNINKFVKLDLLQSEVEKMEEKVKRKELMMRYKKKEETNLEKDEVDDCIINSIKAKLGMLDFAQSNNHKNL